MNVGGYSIPVGNGSQLVTLPWGNIDQIKVVFSENVTVNQDDLKLDGVNLAAYAFKPDLPDGSPNDGFVYNPATFTATWTLTGPIGSDKLLLQLNADGSNPIEDAAGNRLDGEWTNPTSTTQSSSSTYPSGNGTAGGDFSFRFNVLPGDATGNGTVDTGDLTVLSGHWKQSGVLGGDFNGDGVVNTGDLTMLSGNCDMSLPSAEPVAGSFGSPPTVTNVAVVSTAWTSAYLSSSATQNSMNIGGYSIPVGSGSQLATLPWGNIDQIKVVFSENVTVDQDDLKLDGVNLAEYAFKPDLPDGSPNDGFVYDPATFTATWTLTGPIGRDKLLLQLNADGSSPIEDSAGNRSGRRLDESDEHNGYRDLYLPLRRRHGRGRFLVPLQCAARRCHRERYGRYR